MRHFAPALAALAVLACGFRPDGPSVFTEFWPNRWGSSPPVQRINWANRSVRVFAPEVDGAVVDALIRAASKPEPNKLDVRLVLDARVMATHKDTLRLLTKAGCKVYLDAEHATDSRYVVIDEDEVVIGARLTDRLAGMAGSCVVVEEQWSGAEFIRDCDDHAMHSELWAEPAP